MVSEMLSSALYTGNRIQNMTFLFLIGLAEQIQNLEDLGGRLNEFGTYNDDVNNTLKKLEEKLDAHMSLGSTAKDPKYQDKIAVSL